MVAARLSISVALVPIAISLLFQFISISSAGLTGYTIPGGGTVVPAITPGASAVVTVTGYYHGSGESKGSCQYNSGEGTCLIYLPPNPDGTAATCPGAPGSSTSIQSAFSDPTCGGSSPYTIPSGGCIGISSGDSCISGSFLNPSGTCSGTYYSSDVAPASGGMYTACGYYTDNLGGCSPGLPGTCYDTHLVSSYPVYFTVNPIDAPATPYGSTANVFSNPLSFTLGSAPTISMYSPIYQNLFGIKFGTICNPGDNCVVEIANIVKTGGCVDPLAVPQPTCSYGPIKTSCVTKTSANIFSSGSRTFYNQTLNTAYLGAGDYAVCEYDYHIVSGSVVASPYSAMEITCNGGTCQTNGVPPPNSVSIPVVGYPSGCSSPNGPAGCGWGTTGGSLGAAGSAAGFISTVCGVYGYITIAFGLLAIVLILVAAILYMASYTLSGQTAGVLRGYAQGLLIAGVLSGVIVAVGIALIYIATGYPIGYPAPNGAIGSCTIP